VILRQFGARLQRALGWALGWGQCMAGPGVPALTWRGSSHLLFRYSFCIQGGLRHPCQALLKEPCPPPPHPHPSKGTYVLAHNCSRSGLDRSMGLVRIHVQ